MENKISIKIPEKVVTDYLAKISEAAALIAPYIATVADDEKVQLLKLGDKTTPFVAKSVDYSEVGGKEFTPLYLDVPEFKQDVIGLEQFDKLFKPTNQLLAQISDTRSLLAHDAFNAALLYYAAVKNAAHAGVSKAKSIYDDLAKRFPGRPPKNKKTVE